MSERDPRRSSKQGSKKPVRRTGRAAEAQSKAATAGGRPKSSRKAPARQTSDRRAAASTARSKSRRPPPPRAPKKRRPARVFRMADPRKRLRVLLVGVCVLMSLLAGRLVQLQGLDASTYVLTASQIGRKDVPLPAERGDILDRNGEPLARTVEAYNVYADQTQVGNPAAYALQLEAMLDVDASTLQERLTGDRQFTYLAKDVTGSTWRDIEALDLEGVGAENAGARAYPAGSVAGDVVGFVGSDGTPLAGLEMAQDEVLAGKDGWMVYQESPTGQRIPNGSVVGQDPVAGDGLRLTLDRDVQWYAEEALADAVDNAGADGGVAVALKLEPDAHEIVALAGMPSVDPNNPEDTDAADRGSRAVEEAYEPGSVFKPLTMAAIIEEGAADPSTVLSVSDSIRRSGHNINDYYSHPEQEMTLAGILAKSSNVGTLLAAELIGKSAFRDYLVDFGLGERTGIGLPAETAGHLREDWTDLTRDNISFGQGVSVNAVQMASAYAAIANDGVRIDPTLISATFDSDGEEDPAEPAERNRVVSEETAAQVTSMMEAVMGPEGTGESAAIDGYRVAGKTGTAQRVDPSCGCYGQYNSSFMGFAPADDPEYVVVVSLMNPRNGNSGGGLAGPAFADIMRFALERDGVRPSGEPAPELPLFADDTSDE